MQDSFFTFQGAQKVWGFCQNLWWHGISLCDKFDTYIFPRFHSVLCQALANYPVLLAEFLNLFFSSRTFLFSLLSWSTSRELYELQRRADSVDGFSHEAGVAGLVKGVGVVVQLCEKKIEVAFTTFRNPTVLLYLKCFIWNSITVLKRDWQGVHQRARLHQGPTLRQGWAEVDAEVLGRSDFFLQMQSVKRTTLNTVSR